MGGLEQRVVRKGRLMGSGVEVGEKWYALEGGGDYGDWSAGKRGRDG